MFERLRLKLKFYEFVRNPNKTSLIFEMYELASRVHGASEAVAAVESRAMEDRGFCEIFKRRVFLEIPPLRELSAATEGSLANAYAAHMRAHGLAVNFYRAPGGNRVIDTISHRLYQTHDLWHVILGYDTSPAGELSVQAFTLAQLGTPFSLLLMAGGMLGVVELKPQLAEKTFGAMAEAYQRGKTSEFLLGFLFEEHWKSPLADIRKRLRLT